MRRVELNATWSCADGECVIAQGLPVNLTVNSMGTAYVLAALLGAFLSAQPGHAGFSWTTVTDESNLQHGDVSSPPCCITCLQPCTLIPG